MKVWLGVMTLLMGLLGTASVFPAMLSVMILDAPGAMSNPATMALFASVLSCPLVCFGCISAAWMLFTESCNRLAGFVIAAPLINVVVAGIAWYCLMTFYDGKFNG